MKHTPRPDAIRLVITGTNPSATLKNMYRKEDWSVKVPNKHECHTPFKTAFTGTPCKFLNNKKIE
jgi:hypothetical protein